MPDVSDPLRPLADVFKPDERQPNLVQSLEDVHAILSGLVLHERVPVDVRQLFETAKNVRLYSYFVYRFHQVAQVVAYQALEMALLLRWEQEQSTTNDGRRKRQPTLQPLLEEAARRQWLRNDGFSGRYWRAERALLSERTTEAIRIHGMESAGEITIPAPTENEIAKRADDIDVVGALITAVPSLRNKLAHGSSMLVPMSDHVLQDVADAINMLFDEHGGGSASIEH